MQEALSLCGFSFFFSFLRMIRHIINELNSRRAEVCFPSFSLSLTLRTGSSFSLTTRWANSTCWATPPHTPFFYFILGIWLAVCIVKRADLVCHWGNFSSSKRQVAGAHDQGWGLRGDVTSSLRQWGPLLAEAITEKDGVVGCLQWSWKEKGETLSDILHVPLIYRYINKM